MRDIAPIIDGVVDEITSLRHEIHENPELKYEESGTAERVLKHIRPIEGIEIRTGVAETGVVATLGGERDGPCVALRADMDAFPMEETTDVAYRSKVPGKMHACGHDGHTSCLVGAVKVLSEIRDDLEGPVKFIFQPAEEGGAGGKRMCEEGVLDDPKVDAIFGFHGWPDFPQGQVGVHPGAFLASSDTFDITIGGTGAHAAFPHFGVDPIVVASHVVTAIQSVVSRNTDPLQSAVVTVADIKAGTAYNIIPQTATLKGTIRALDEMVRQTTHERVRQIAEKTAEAFGARADVTNRFGYPVTFNHQNACDYAQGVVDGIEDLAGQDMLPVMGGEDFSFYSERIPAMFLALGVRPLDRDTYPNLHQSDYDFADGAIPHGIRLHTEIARQFASRWTL
ncbi:TPA: amidohydrolase [Candidatus Latescibacteria bacterium]|nr:amidohydrolase [Candidatus Latescibacterota bacterium]